MRIPLLEGRAFTETDNRRATPRVVIINDALRRRYWRNANPLGQHLAIDGQHFEIVGVVGNVRHDNLAAAGRGEIYLPQYQGGTPPWTFFAIHSHAGLGSLIPAVRKALPEAAAKLRIPILCMVAENDSTTAAVQSVYDAARAGLEPALLQHPRQQLRVVRGVLDEQDVQRDRHDAGAWLSSSQ